MFYLLRVYADVADLPAGEPGVALYRVEGATRTLMASDARGVSLAPMDGVELARILTHEPADVSRKAWLRRAGLALYERLAPEPVARVLADLEPAPVMLELGSRALASVPWELCRRPGVAHPLFADTERAWFLGADQPEPQDERMVAADWPLRVLVVLGSEPDDKRVQAVDEVYALEQLALGGRDEPADASGPGAPAGGSTATRCDMMLYTLFQPDLDELERTLHSYRPHVFHFIGHGRLREGEPELRVFSRAEKVYHAWGYDQIGTAFPPRAAPRLVYLDACHAAVDQPDAWSLTQAFRDIGAGAILAMQREITGSSAVDMARELYAQLLAGRSLEGALAGVRRSFIAMSRDEWYVPRLWVRGDPERLRPSPNPSPDIAADLARCPRLETSAYFVDRWPQRYQVWRALEQQPNAGALLLFGDSQAGKTSFAHWLMESAALEGRAVRYVNLGDARGDYLSVLDALAESMETPPGAALEAPVADAFADYRAFVHTQGLHESPERAGHYRERVMRLFWDGVRAHASERAWFVVLDHLQPGPFSDQVVAREIAFELLHLFRPPDTLGSVRVVLVVNHEQAQAIRAQRFERGLPSVELNAFSELERDHYMPLYFDWRARDLPALATDASVRKQVQDLIVSGNVACPQAFAVLEPFLLLIARGSG